MNRKLAAFQVNERKRVRIILSDSNGKKVLHIRMFHLNSMGTWSPSLEGLVLEADKLSSLLFALRKAERELDKSSDGPPDTENGSQEVMRPGGYRVVPRPQSRRRRS